MTGNRKESDQDCDEYLIAHKVPVNTVVTKVVGWIRNNDRAVSGLALYQEGQKLVECGAKLNNLPIEI